MLVPMKSVTTMSSREIADLTGKEHKHVLTDIRNMLDELDLDEPEFRRIYFDSMNRQQTEFALNRELTDTLLTGYSTKLRHVVIARWHELESQFAIPKTYSQAMRLAADQADQIEAQEAQLAIAAPAVAFVGRYVEATGLKGFREVAKLLKVKEPEFREFLESKNIMYRLGGGWTAYAPHIEAGRFEIRTGESESGHAFNTAKFTPKGVAWIAGEYAKAQIAEAVK